MSKSWNDCLGATSQDIIDDYAQWFSSESKFKMSYQERKDLLTTIRRKEILKQRREVYEFNKLFS